MKGGKNQQSRLSSVIQVLQSVSKIILSLLLHPQFQPHCPLPNSATILASIRSLTPSDICFTVTSVFAWQSQPEWLNFSACLPFKPILCPDTSHLICFFLPSYIFQNIHFLRYVSSVFLRFTSSSNRMEIISCSFYDFLYPEAQLTQTLKGKEVV